MFANTISDGDNRGRRIDNEQTLKSIFSKTEPQTKKCYTKFFSCFLTWNHPLLGCTTNSGPPCIYSSVLVARETYARAEIGEINKEITCRGKQMQTKPVAR